MRLPALAKVALALASSPVPSWAGADPLHPTAPLHFSHPLVAESPSPDTKARLDYLFLNETADAGETHSVRFEAEYALAPWISLELDIPYSFRDPEGGRSADHLDTLEMGIKLASFALAERGLLLGGGVEVGLPTGSDSRGIGSNHIVEIEPFVDFGWKRQRFEVVGFLSTGFLHNERPEDADFELSGSLSLLCHLHPRLQALLEVDGEEVSGGEEDGHSALHLTPGLKVRPLRRHDLWIGAGVSLPLTADRAFDARAIVSVFWHF